MVKRVQRVGHDAVAAAAFIGLPREITVDIDNSELRVHDGVTEGGHPVAKKSDVILRGGFVSRVLVEADPVVWPADNNYLLELTLTANRQMGTPTGLINGNFHIVNFIQDATGGHAVTWAAGFNFGSAAQPIIDVGANKETTIIFLALNDELRFINAVGGF